jgi:hypothetical protein
MALFESLVERVSGHCFPLQSAGRDTDTVSPFRARARSICERELSRWQAGNGGTPSSVHAKIVGEYWRIGAGINGRDGATEYIDPAGRRFRPPWSAAFVSYVYRLAGAGTHFLYHQAHVHYVVLALNNTLIGIGGRGFYARDPAGYRPQIGDLIVEQRGGEPLALADLVRRYGGQSPPNGLFIPMHADIVVDIWPQRSRLRTIGGNIIGGNVAERIWNLDERGQLRPVRSLICVLEARL